MHHTHTHTSIHNSHTSLAVRITADICFCFFCCCSLSTMRCEFLFTALWAGKNPIRIFTIKNQQNQLNMFQWNVMLCLFFVVLLPYSSRHRRKQNIAENYAVFLRSDAHILRLIQILFICTLNENDKHTTDLWFHVVCEARSSISFKQTKIHKCCGEWVCRRQFES